MVSITVTLFINDSYRGSINLKYVPFSDTFSIDLNSFVSALKPIQNSNAISDLMSIPNPDITDKELEELGYQIASYNKQKLILKIISPVESRKLNVLEFKDSSITPTYYKPSPISGSSSFQLFQYYSSVTNLMSPLEFKNRTNINYGNNLFSYDGSGYISNWTNNYINLSRTIMDTKISLGDVKSFSISNIDSQSSIWGLNIMHAPSKSSALNDTKDYSIFLEKDSYITILINDSPYASYKLPAGPHKITNISKVFGNNNVVIKAKELNSPDTKEVLSKSFYYDPNNIPQTWKFNLHYGYPKLIENTAITYQSHLTHAGAHIFYVYTPYLSTDHFLSFGPNFQLYGLSSNFFTSKGNAIWKLAFGQSDSTETYFNSLLFNTKTNPNKSEEPWRFTATHTESYLNFAIDKGANFFNSMSYIGNYNYNIRNALTSQRYASTFQWNITKSQSFAYSNSFSIGTKFDLNHQFRYKIAKESWNLNINLDYSPSRETPFNFSFIFTQSLSRLGLSYMLDTFKLHNLSYVKSIDSDTAFTITESIPKKHTTFQFKNDQFNLSSFLDKSEDISRTDYVAFYNDIFNFSYNYRENSNQEELFKHSSYTFSTNIFFTDSAFSISSAETDSFAIISPQYNLMNKPIKANEFENNFMGNILVPLKGATTLLLEAPDASMWSELGQQSYLLNPTSFSGYHIKFGGIGTHAAMFIFQDKDGNPLIKAKVTIKPIQTNVEIEEKSYSIGFGGRIVALGLVSGKYKLTFENAPFGDIIFSISETDEPLVRFGIIEVGVRNQIINPQSQAQVKQQQEELLKRLFKSDSNNNNNKSIKDPNNTILNESNQDSDNNSDLPIKSNQDQDNNNDSKNETNFNNDLQSENKVES